MVVFKNIVKHNVLMAVFKNIENIMLLMFFF